MFGINTYFFKKKSVQQRQFCIFIPTVTSFPLFPVSPLKGLISSRGVPRSGLPWGVPVSCWCHPASPARSSCCSACGIALRHRGKAARAGTAQPGGEKLQGELPVASQCLEEPQERWRESFQGPAVTGQGGIGFKLTENRIRLDIRKKL